MDTNLETHFGYLFEDDLIEEIAKVGAAKSFKKDAIIIDLGDVIQSMPIVLTGAVKILREDEHEEELLLYYLENGDTCAMTLSCCMGQTKSKIRAVAETDVTLIMLPKKYMTLWLSAFQSWQAFILQSYHNRVEELLTSVDTIAFLKMDERLFKYLKDRAMVIQNNQVTTTHKEIADDLHTSRVVISRLLKKLENEGKIKLFRNSITILEL